MEWIRPLIFLLVLPALLGAGCRGGAIVEPSRSEETEEPADVTPPAVVDDLTAVTQGEDSVLLRWTAPGDDGRSGRAASYDLRFSEEERRPWKGMTPVESLPTPSAAGEAESLEVAGLVPGATYYFRVRTADEMNNWSAVSAPSPGRTMEIISSLVPELVPVPAGDFVMGDGEAYCGEAARDVHLTGDYRIGRYEVTNGEYRNALEWALSRGYVRVTDTSVVDNAGPDGVELVDLDAQWCELSFDGRAFHVQSGRENHPVVEVTWYGAASFCNWLSIDQELVPAYDPTTWLCNNGDPYGAEGYRLPTDAEWERAARFGDGRIYPWGNDAPAIGRANFGNYVGGTSPVGSFPGLPVIEGEPVYDLGGNVWEYCNDRHACDPGAGPAVDPVGPDSGEFRVIRGGAWFVAGRWLRGATRFYVSPGSSDWNLDGFRIARSGG